MPDHQRIFVVSATGEGSDLSGLPDDAGRAPVALTAPTAEAERVVRRLRVEPEVDVLLAPVRFPHADRGHRLDELVRRHALRDRFRDVVVVTDAASATLLLRVLAPDQLPTGGAVTVVGLPRGERPIAVRRAVLAGLGLGVIAALAQTWLPILVLPAATALVGAGLMVGETRRHVGRELLLAAAISVAVVLVLVAGSARFPGGW